MLPQKFWVRSNTRSRLVWICACILWNSIRRLGVPFEIQTKIFVRTQKLGWIWNKTFWISALPVSNAACPIKACNQSEIHIWALMMGLKLTLMICLKMVIQVINRNYHIPGISRRLYVCLFITRFFSNKRELLSAIWCWNWQNISVCGAVIYWAVGYAFAYGVLDNDPNGVNKFIGSKYFFTWVRKFGKLSVKLRIYRISWRWFMSHKIRQTADDSYLAPGSMWIKRFIASWEPLIILVIIRISIILWPLPRRSRFWRIIL